MNLEIYLKEKKKTVDSFLRQYIAAKKKHKECPRGLADAMGYALMAGGKRARPILCIASYEASGGRSKKILPIACSLELIHTYSLIHDDLPAMDNDDFRRNMPTTHKVFGEATAILAGDALLTDAFNMIVQSKAGPGTLVKVIHEMSSACGPEGLVGGQTVDLLLEGKKAGKKDLIYIHTHKTGALIKASVRTGAIVANASTDKLKYLTEYGEKVGLAFQVVDDILDITGTKEEIGKSTGADSARGKNTYPSIFGLKKSRDIATALANESIEALSSFNKRADPLREIADYIISRRN
jgi:geranylgeranyl diphosphate synthase type II